MPFKRDDPATKAAQAKGGSAGSLESKAAAGRKGGRAGSTEAKAAAGRVGGSVKSDAKTEASRANIKAAAAAGLLTGRPPSAAPSKMALYKRKQRAGETKRRD